MKVVVIGAGISGATSAFRIKRKYPEAEIKILYSESSPNTTSDIAAGWWGYGLMDIHMMWPLTMNQVGAAPGPWHWARAGDQVVTRHLLPAGGPQPGRHSGGDGDPDVRWHEVSGHHHHALSPRVARSSVRRLTGMDFTEAEDWPGPPVWAGVVSQYQVTPTVRCSQFKSEVDFIWEWCHDVGSDGKWGQTSCWTIVFVIHMGAFKSRYYIYIKLIIDQSKYLNI